LFLRLALILFRIFDILKPGIIGRVDEKIKGGLGIMLDDVLAAIFAGICFIILLPLFLLIYKILCLV
jgi:phosphatidylglycerophosphatase A